MKRFILLLTFALSACAGEMTANIQTVDGVDANQYLGTWYEIARLDNRFERDLEQVTATYSLREDGGIKVINRGFNTQKNDWSEAEGKAYFTQPINKDGTYKGQLKVSFFGPFYGPYNIIALDKIHYNYALVTSGKEYLWILSRTPQLTYPIKQELMAQAKALGYPTENLIFVKQANQVEYESGRHVVPAHN
ncbi:MAG TPA: lipocalin family protein [Methylotenera sp.]|nr:lipocalin family protein [Methylotenera sp.]HPH04331.1 lipocalin family protein [Methylotenera sp.]HPM99885.1 lipocalin family protein [Methylotenera sp.]